MSAFAVRALPLFCATVGWPCNTEHTHTEAIPLFSAEHAAVDDSRSTRIVQQPLGGHLLELGSKWSVCWHHSPAIMLRPVGFSFIYM